MKTFCTILFIGLGMIGTMFGVAASALPVHPIILVGGAPYYSPVNATVMAGQPIEWINRTASPHTITHVGCLEDGELCAFDSGALAPGARFSVYYLPPGRYPYRCQLHPIMEGIVIVKEPVRVADVVTEQP